MDRPGGWPTFARIGGTAYLRTIFARANVGLFPLRVQCPTFDRQRVGTILDRSKRGQTWATRQINALANIAVIGPTINIRISSKNPMDYLDRYKISSERLEEQFVPSDRLQFGEANYPQFLASRAKTLAAKANEYLGALRGSIRTDSEKSPQN